jgi:hypothetical protein
VDHGKLERQYDATARTDEFASAALTSVEEENALVGFLRMPTEAIFKVERPRLTKACP